MKRRLLAGFAAALVLAAGGFLAWIATLPPAAPPTSPTPVPETETRAALEALRPPKRARPLVAVVGINDATEVTDYLMTYGILARADVADIVALATGPGPIRLYPALAVEPEATVAEFDARHPEGADYVIVPAMSRDDDPTALAFIRGQAGKGAIVIAVCAGAKVAAAAGLLEGRRGTTHWYYRAQLHKIEPTLAYVPDRRFVVEDGIATTTGITASAPMMLTLVEAIAGRGKASEVAADLGLAAWDARHASAGFGLTRPFARTALANRLAVWGHERFALPVADGVDEVSLALVADAWSRTYRSGVLTVASGEVTTRGGLRLLPDLAAPSGPTLPPAGDLPAAASLDRALAAIAGRYGPATADFVAAQLEYPRPE